jgi:hypothetical protein
MGKVAMGVSDERFCAICWRKRAVEELEKDDGGAGTWWRCRDREACAAVAEEWRKADRAAWARKAQAPG